VLNPHRNWYRKSEQLSTEVAILSTWRHDLYLILAGLDPEGEKASFKVYLNPLVSWFWWGGIVMCLGGVLVLLPRPRKAAHRGAATAGARCLRDRGDREG